MTLAFTLAISSLTMTAVAFLIYAAFLFLSIRSSGRVLRRLDELQEYLDEELFEPDDSSN